MLEFTRLWFVVAGGDSGELDELARALAPRPIAALACAAEPSSRAAAATLAAEARMPVDEWPDLRGPATHVLRALDRLTAEHADLEVGVVAPGAALQAALEVALGLGRARRAALALRAGALFAFDWPTGREAGTRPLLIGADLDWLPPWTSGREHARHPGGPGAAGTARG